MIKRLLWSTFCIHLLTSVYVLDSFAANSVGSCFGNSDVSLMLHMDGVDTSTTFTDDQASSPHTVTANDDAQVDTAQSKFGGASALFDGTGDFLSTPDSADWDFGSGDFTIDFWIMFNSVASTQRIVGQWGATDIAFLVQWNISNNLNFFWSTDGSGSSSVSFAWTPSDSTWYHVALVRSSGSLEAFIDGTQIGIAQTVSGTFFDGTEDLQIGQVAALQPVNGWIDEFRIVNGTAVWTANFTVETRPYIECENKTQ